MSPSAQSLNPLFIRSQFQMAVEGIGDEGGYIQSQSLIHQVSVSDFENARIRNDFVKPCLNPLFIRSQFQMVTKIDVNQTMKGVSIPYSSGLSFRCLL